MQRLACLVCLIALFLVTPAAAEGPAVRILEAVDGNALAFTTPAATFAFPITLYEPQALATPAPVRLSLGEVTRADGQPAQGALFSLVLPSGVGVGAVQLQADELAVIELRGELPDPGSYRSTLALSAGQDRQLYTIEVTRAAAPDVLVGGASGGALALSAGDADYTQTIFLRLAEGQPAVDDLRLSIGPIQRADGLELEQAALDCDLCDGAARSIQPGQPLALALRALLPESGAYQADLTLGLGSRDQVVALTITRLARPDHLKLGIASPLNITLPLCGPGEIRLAVELAETGGRSAAVASPAVRQASLSPKSGATRVFTPAQSASLEGKQPADSSPIAAYEIQQYRLILSGISAPGTYTGAVVVGGPESASASAPFEVRARAHPLRAALAIALGVTLAFLLILAVQRLRPLLRLKEDAAGLREKAASDPLLSGDPYRDFLDVELLAVLSVGWKGIIGNNARLDDLRLRYENFHEILRLAQAARQSLNPDKLPDLGRAVDQARVDLAGALPLKEDKVKEILKTFQDTLHEIQKKTPPPNWSMTYGFELFNRPAAPVLSAVQTRSRRVVFDLALAGIVLALAVAVGYQTLYLPNPTFGGWDYLAAVLWGLGLQGGAAGLSGLLALLKLKPE